MNKTFPTDFASVSPALSDSIIIADDSDSDKSKITTIEEILGLATRDGEIVFRIDGAGSAITTGDKKLYVRVAYDCTITGWDIVLDQSGSIALDIRNDALGNFPPTVTDTITASAKPTVSSAITTSSSTLTGWTTSLTAGTYLEINVDSASTCTVAILTLKVTA